MLVSARGEGLSAFRAAPVQGLLGRFSHAVGHIGTRGLIRGS